MRRKRTTSKAVWQDVVVPAPKGAGTWVERVGVAETGEDIRLVHAVLSDRVFRFWLVVYPLCFGCGAGLIAWVWLTSVYGRGVLMAFVLGGVGWLVGWATMCFWIKTELRHSHLVGSSIVEWNPLTRTLQFPDQNLVLDSGCVDRVAMVSLGPSECDYIWYQIVIWFRFDSGKQCRVLAFQSGYGHLFQVRQFASRSGAEYTSYGFDGRKSPTLAELSSPDAIHEPPFCVVENSEPDTQA